jgi:class 3 adenylate cyclase
MVQQQAYNSRRLAVMVMGIGGFVPISDVAGTADALVYLNSLIPAVERGIHQGGGEIIRYPMGDVIGVWGAEADSELAGAVGSTEEIAMSLITIIREGKKRGFPKLQVGIGLAYGQCAVRIERDKCIDVAGGPVNTAMRLQVNARKLGYILLLDASVAERIPRDQLIEVQPDAFTVRELT